MGIHGSFRSVQPQKPPVVSPTDEFGANQTISPRSELLSPSTDRDRAHRSSKRRHKKHRSSRSHNDHSMTSDASQRELLRIVLDQEAEADNLKAALRTTLERLNEESRKAAEYEKGHQEASDKLREISESKAAAEQAATRAAQQLRVYEFQLHNAQKEIQSAHDTQKVLEKQKEEAEELAARARARARKLLQKQMVFQAKEEGRRMGFEAGVRQAQDELTISTTARRALAPSDPPSHSSSRRKDRRRRSEEPTPPPESPAEDVEEDSGSPIAEQTVFSEGDSSTLRTPIFPRAPLFPVHHEEQPEAQPNPSHTPNIQVYSLDIPPPDQIQSHPSQRPSRWVTAQEHRDLNGSQTSHSTPLQPMARPSESEEVVIVEPMRRPRSTSQPPPPPAPVFPVGVPIMQQSQSQAMYTQTPPKSAKKPRFRIPSLKDKAQSWYRSFSLRRKNKPVLDPTDEDSSAKTPTAQNGHANGNGNPEQQMYNFQPNPPQSWYHEPRRASEDARSQRSRLGVVPKGHSRSASMDDQGGDLVSRASTRLSQLDLLHTAPTQNQGPGDTGSVSGRSTHTNTKKLGQKLSTINEDSRRFTSPLAEVFLTGSRTGPEPVPFTLPPVSVRSKKRPPEIAVPPPPGFSPNDPFIQGNYHIIPPNGHAPPLAAKSSGISTSTGSGPIGISVQPAVCVPSSFLLLSNSHVLQSAAIYDNQPTTAPPNSGNHLTPHYVYRPPNVPARSPQRDPVDLSWDPVPMMTSEVPRNGQQSTHRQTQSFHAPPQGYSDNRSVRSSHSRTGSAQGGRPQDTRRTSTAQRSAHQQQYADPTYLTASPHAASVRTSGSKKALPQSPQNGHAIRRVSSRGSMMSTHDPSNYIDPAFYAPDGTADPNMLHAHNRGLNRTPSLEYVDP